MKLNKIKAKYFNSYDELYFNFNEGIWLITGKNGSGKSTLFDIITFTFFGKTRTDIDSVIKIGKPYAKTILSFEVNGKEYKIVRKRERNKGSELKFIGENTSLTNPTITETQEEIEKIIGFNYESFISSAYFGQGQLTNFMDKTPKERKELFFEILGLEIYKLAEIKTKEKIKIMELNISENEISLDNFNGLITEYNDDLDGLEYNEIDYNIENDKLKIIKNKTIELYNALAKKKAIIEKFGLLTRIINEKEENDLELIELYENIKELNIEIKKIAKKIEKINEKKVKGELVKLDSKNKICPTCGAKIINEKNINRIEELGIILSNYAVLMTKQTGIDMKLKEINKSIFSLNKRNGIIVTQLNGERIEDLKNKDKILKNVELMQKEINTLDEKSEETSDILTEMEKHKILINSKTKKIKELQRKINMLKKENKSYTSTLKEYKILQKAFSKDGIPSHILENILPELEIETNKFLEDIMDEPFEIKYIVQGKTKAGKIKNTFDIDIIENSIKRAFNTFSGGEKVRISIAIRLAISKLLSGIVGTDLEFLLIDEIEYLDSEGLEKFVEIINKLQKNFKTIIVISHIQELQQQFENIIQVEKVEEGSRINII